MLRSVTAPELRSKFAVLAAGLIAVGWFRFIWQSDKAAKWIQSNVGYYMVFAAVGLWLYCAYKIWTTTGGSRKWSKLISDKVGLAVLFAAIMLPHALEPHVLRVLYDEPAHVATSLVMHTEKKALLPALSHYVGDVYLLGGLYPSSRQYLFPFLLSILHDLTGYRLSNVFALNGILSAAAAIMVFGSGWRLGGRAGGIAGVLLFWTTPLVHQNITCGGYDILNVFLLATLIYAGLELCQSDENCEVVWIEFGSCTAVLLSMSRSESVIYCVVWAGLVAVRWWRKKRITVGWFSVAAPLLLLPNLACSLILLSNPQAMDPVYVTGGRKYMSIDYLPAHLAELFTFLFSFDSSASNNLLLSICGVFGIVGAGLLFFRSPQKRSTTGILLYFCGSVAVVYAVVLCQHWSGPSDIMAARFSLPWLLALSLAGAWFLAECRLPRPLLLIAFSLWYLFAAVPSLSKAIATYTFMTAREFAWLRDQTEKRSRTETLYVAPSNLGLIACRRASLGLDVLNRSPLRFVQALKSGIYKEVIVFQELEMDLNSGQWVPRLKNEINAQLVLEPLEEKVVGPSYRCRVFRLVGLKEGDKILTPESDVPSLRLKTGFKNRGEMDDYIVSTYPN